MVHFPNGSLHFLQKWCVVVFMILQLSAGICDDALLTIWVDLGQNGAKAPWIFIVSKSGVDD